MHGLGARDEAWRQTERLSPIEQTLASCPANIPSYRPRAAPRLAGLLAVEGAGDDDQALNRVRSPASAMAPLSCGRMAASAPR
jgi:hypothetical protein